MDKKKMLESMRKKMPSKDKGAMPEFDISEMEIELGEEEAPEEESMEMDLEEASPLEAISDKELLAEMKRRGLQQGEGSMEEEDSLEIAKPVPMAKKKSPKEEEYA